MSVASVPDQEFSAEVLVFLDHYNVESETREVMKTLGLTSIDRIMVSIPAETSDFVTTHLKLDTQDAVQFKKAADFNMVINACRSAHKRDNPSKDVQVSSHLDEITNPSKMGIPVETRNALVDKNYINGAWGRGFPPPKEHNPSTELLAILIREGSDGAYSVTPFGKMVSLENEQSKFLDKTDESILQIRGGKLVAKVSDMYVKQQFHIEIEKLLILATAWQIVGRCDWITIYQFHYLKLKSMAARHPSKKAGILLADKKIRGLWIQERHNHES